VDKQTCEICCKELNIKETFLICKSCRDSSIALLFKFYLGRFFNKGESDSLKQLLRQLIKKYGYEDIIESLKELMDRTLAEEL